MLRFNRFPNGKTKCFTLSYDDGKESDRHFIEIVNRYGVRATFHLNSGCLSYEGRIHEDEICALYKGHEISMHSSTHPTLTQMPLSLALREVADDRARLEAVTGGIIRGMSYPNGPYNDAILSILRNVGVSYCRTTKSTFCFDWPDDFRVWHPTCHHQENSVQRIHAFLEAKQPGALFYIWGHSYEFNDNNNWSLLEDICKTITADAGDEWYQKADTVWLATNIEICDYITAIRNLIVSMDGKIIQNPAALDVWVEADGEALKIPAGATIRL